MAVIYSTEDREGEDNNDLIKKFMNPAHLKVGIKRPKKISKGGILMEVNPKKEFKKLENQVNTNEKLKGKFTIKKMIKLGPKF